MSLIEVTLPKMGESISEATVLNWLKQVGDTVEADETLLEVATDKVDSEVPSPCDGIIKEIKCQSQDVIAIGSVIAVIEATGEVKVSSQKNETKPDNKKGPKPSKSSKSEFKLGTQDPDAFLSPLVVSLSLIHI